MNRKTARVKALFKKSIKLSLNGFLEVKMTLCVCMLRGSVNILPLFTLISKNDC